MIGTSELKAANRRLNERERAEAKARLASYPMQVQVEATNRCNLVCGTCARNYYPKALNRIGDLNPRDYPELETLFAHAERVLLGGYGEPLMGKHVKAILRLAAKHQCFIEIINNGTFLSEEWYALSAELPVGRYLFSVDGASDKTMMQRRGVPLTQILTHVARLREVAPEVESTFNVTLSRHNIDEIPELVRIAAEHGVRAVFVAHQKLYIRAQGGDSALEEPERLRTAFDKAWTAARESGVDLHLPPTEGVHECMQPLEMMMIRRDGAAFACCSAMFGGGTHRIELGRLGEGDVLDLWNAPAAINARRRILGLPHGPGPCETCAFRIFTPEAMRRFLDGDEASKAALSG
ncbi:MAG: radical SAM protein [Deltaproteobacteria bacterium]|nr:radical SAM protein [Deltaproteobacteria bacterium]MCB9490175.1 radical SAM protein [Deltaproteobacteria bacterium]